MAEIGFNSNATCGICGIEFFQKASWKLWPGAACLKCRVELEKLKQSHPGWSDAFVWQDLQTKAVDKEIEAN